MALSFGEKLQAALVPPGLQRMVRLLRRGGFMPTAYHVDDYNTIIDIDCPPERLFVEAHRLHQYLWSLRLAAYIRAIDGTELEDDPFIAIQAVYDPGDGEATIELWGVRDALLH